MLKHAFAKLNAPSLMGGSIFQNTLSSGMTTYRGIKMANHMSKFGRIGQVPNYMIAGNMV